MKVNSSGKNPSSNSSEMSNWTQWMIWSLVLFAVGSVLSNLVYSVFPNLAISMVPLAVAYGIGLTAMLKLRTSWLFGGLVSRDSEPVRYWIGICLYLSFGTFFSAILLFGWLFEVQPNVQ